MKPLLYYVIAILWMIIGCSKANTANDEDTLPAVTLVKNEGILAKTLLYTEWSTVPAVMSMSYADLRNALITDLAGKCKNTLSSLMAMRDYDLAWNSMIYKFLIESGTKTDPELKMMLLDDCRNAIIDLNTKNSSYSVSELQGFANNKNLNIAYKWWFYKNSQTKSKIDKFNNITISNPSFGMKDNRGATMDVLRVVKADEVYTYLGVYHSMVSNGQFKLYLAGSNDLKNWTYLTELGDRAHQGEIKKWGSGYLIANEQDPIQGSNNIQIRFYSSYTSLVAGIPSNDKSISRSFSSFAEGTPDIRIVEGSSPSASNILIGYHFYDNGIRDQQAFGILKNFTDWRTWKDEVSNYNIQLMGYNGNIGGRSGFVHNRNYVLQEAQVTSGDWSSWRLLFGDGAFYYTLNNATPLGSVSFANPGIALISGTNTFAVTSFLPSQGNQNGEIGELLYSVQF